MDQIRLRNIRLTYVSFLQSFINSTMLIFKGIVESTGMTTQVRTSYLPGEILWAHRPASLLAYQKENGHYRVDYSQFHAVVPINMPEYSAKTLADKERRPSYSEQWNNNNNKLVDFVRSRNRPSMLKRMRSSFRSKKSRRTSGSIRSADTTPDDSNNSATKFESGGGKKCVYLSLWYVPPIVE